MIRLLTPKQKFVTTLIYGILAVVLSAGLFLKLWLVVADAGQELHTIKTAIASSEEERKQINKEEVLLKQRETDLAKINSFFVEREQPLRFIENLEALGKKTKNDITIELNEAQNKGAIDLSFRLTVEGSIKSITQYLRLLYLMPYLVTVDDFVLQKVLQAQEIGSKINVASYRLLISLKVKAL